VSLKSALGVTQSRWKWYHSIYHVRVPICSPWPYTVSEIKDYIGRGSYFFIHLVHNNLLVDRLQCGAKNCGEVQRSDVTDNRRNCDTNSRT